MSAQVGSQKNILNKTTKIEEDANRRLPLNGSPVKWKRKDFIAKDLKLRKETLCTE